MRVLVLKVVQTVSTRVLYNSTSLCRTALDPDHVGYRAVTRGAAECFTSLDPKDLNHWSAELKDLTRAC